MGDRRLAEPTTRVSAWQKTSPRAMRRKSRSRVGSLSARATRATSRESEGIDQSKIVDV